MLDIKILIIYFASQMQIPIFISALCILRPEENAMLFSANLFGMLLSDA